MIGRSELIRGWGLDGDPFDAWSAEGERAAGVEGFSENAFIAPSFFDLVVGDEQQPRSRIVEGDRGSGKSRLAIEVERALTRRTNPPLVVRYDDFSDLTREKAESSNAAHHALRIAHITIGLLVAHLARLPEVHRTLSQEASFVLDSYCTAVGHGKTTQWRATLDGLAYANDRGNTVARQAKRAGRAVRRYLRERRARLSKLENDGGAAEVAKLAAILAPIRSESTDLQSETPLGILRGIARLVQHLGFPSIVVVVDRVDEGPVLNGRQDLSVSMLRPLLCDLPLLEVPGLAFKFFLTPPILDDLRGAVRTDRVKVEQLTWSREMARDMLDRRLASFSNNRVRGIKAILDELEGDVIANLIAERSGGFPRDVLRLLDRSVAVASLELNAVGPMTLAHVNSGLDRFLTERLTEADAVAYQERVDKMRGAA